MENEVEMNETTDFFDADLVEANISAETLSLVSAKQAIKLEVIPIGYDSEENLMLVTSSPQTLKSQNTLSRRLNKRCRLIFGKEENIRSALVKYYNYEVGRRGNIFAGIRERGTDSSPLAMEVERTIRDAMELGASDIHYLPFSGGIYVQFRINGHLIDYTEKYQFEAEDALPVINIIKGKDTSGNADAAKVNVPNRGSYIDRYGDTLVDVRIATVPIGSEGNIQKAILRLLPQRKKLVKLDNIGYTKGDLRAIKNTLFKSATGLFINSGPTGAGKTTSLYAQINYVLDTAGEPLHVMCIENPIEIKDERFTQVQVREAEQENLQMLPNRILKVGLRSDPDIFLYGEIRDKEDAVVAIEASTTGHRVFTTVHASNCIKTITRLLDLEVSKMSLLSELRMIISQRLVGLLCPNCSKPHKLTEEERKILSEEEIEKLTSFNSRVMERGSKEESAKCPHCNGTGLIGRTAVAEYVIFDTALRDALLNQKSFQEVATLLEEHGFSSMWDKGLYAVRNGWIELKELIQTVGKDT